MRFDIKPIIADKRRMEEYIATRIPVDETVTIELATGMWADLYSTWDDYFGWVLEWETNEPEWVDLWLIYDHFRTQEITWTEWSREIDGQLARWKVRDLEREMAELRREVDLAGITGSQNGVEAPSIQPSQVTEPFSDRFLSAQDIVDYYGGKISLRLAYQIMDECEAVRAGKKRLVTAESFAQYLHAGKAEEQQAADEKPHIASPASPVVNSKRGRSKPDLEFEFFRFQS